MSYNSELEALRDALGHVLGMDILMDEVLSYIGSDEALEALRDIARTWGVEND